VNNNSRHKIYVEYLVVIWQQLEKEFTSSLKIVKWGPQLPMKMTKLDIVKALLKILVH